MATILVDYENVNGTNGLKGADALSTKDTLMIFYSNCCGKIRYDYMQDIKESGCEFHIVKLKGTGKNALDFYIAAECGVCTGKDIGINQTGSLVLGIKRACEKTKVFSCVLLFLDATVAIFYKKVHNSPLPHKKSYYGISLCGSCCFFLFIVIFIKIVSNRNKKYFEQYRFYSSSDSPFVPTVVFYDAKCTFCLNGPVHP